MPFVDLRRHTQVVAIDRGTGCGENLLEIDHDHGILATQRYSTDAGIGTTTVPISATLTEWYAELTVA